LKEKQNNIQKAPVVTTNIADALGSMHIASTNPDHVEDSKATIRDRRRSSIEHSRLAPGETLLSLSSNSQELVERLLQPGMFDDDTDDGARDAKGKKTTKIVQWQETVQLATPFKSKRAVKMPCTLTTPSPESSRESLKPLPDKQGTSAPDISVLGPSNSEVSSTPSPRRSKPLVRSMSMEQREAFVSNLTDASDATIYVLPSSDIHSIHASAIKLGLHARIVMSVDNGDQGLLVLGQDENAVHKMYKKVEIESKKTHSGRMSAVAGGAVVGAVGAWAGLAFS